MKELYFLSFFLITTFIYSQQAGIEVFINEIHYDNSSTDVDEGVEVAGPSGTDLSTFILTAYNGNGGAAYSTLVLSGIIPDEGSGFGTLFFSISGLQNGSPDGIALSDSNDNVQFLSYEGSFDAVDGPASGMTSTDIGVTESSSTQVGESLQLTGTGTLYSDFSWNTPSTANYNSINTNQIFSTTASVGEDKIAGFTIYPNPVSDGNLFIKTQKNGEKGIEIFDVLGKRVLSKKITANYVNISNLKSGIYILKVTENSRTSTRKLVIK